MSVGTVIRRGDADHDDACRTLVEHVTDLFDVAAGEAAPEVAREAPTAVQAAPPMMIEGGNMRPMNAPTNRLAFRRPLSPPSHDRWILALPPTSLVKRAPS